jgi:hypothetical protein
MTTKERLKEYLTYKKIGGRKFERKLGLGYGYVSSKGVSTTSDVIFAKSFHLLILNGS